MRNYLMVIVIAAVFLPACCPMVSVNPLSAPDGIDERLFGIWRPVSEEDEQVYLHVGRESDTTMVALSVEHKRNGVLDTDKLPFFLTRTDKNNYWNVRLEDVDDGLAKGYEGFIFFKYTFEDGDTLLVYQLDREPIITAIQAGQIQGRITYAAQKAPKGAQIKSLATEKSIDCVVITDASPNILNLLEAGNHNALFPEPMRFVREKRGVRPAQ